jgi:hypothetical protein
LDSSCTICPNGSGFGCSPNNVAGIGGGGIDVMIGDGVPSILVATTGVGDGFCSWLITLALRSFRRFVSNCTRRNKQLT